jgi:hypothetical protein
MLRVKMNLTRGWSDAIRKLQIELAYRQRNKQERREAKEASHVVSDRQHGPKRHSSRA